MSIEQEIKVKVKKVLGVAQPFRQGGSIRITIPKRAVKRFNLEEKIVEEEYFALIFLETDKGFLALPFEGPINTLTIREKVLSFLDLSKITDEELEVLLKEEE